MMKKRTGNKVAASIAAAAMMLGTSGISAMAYDYEDKYLWYLPTESFTWDNYDALWRHHKMMGYGKETFDIESLIDSELGESLVKNMEYFLKGYDEMDPEVVKHWKNMGIKKELHDSDDESRVWSSYTPLEVFDPENADKKYPVLFVYHGNNNPLFICESYGFAQLAAKEGYICVMPWADNGAIADTETDRILEILKEKYPIDESRIYAAGFSLGGRTVVSEAIRTPDRFAAINVGGQHLAGVKDIEDFYTDEQWAALKDLPVIQMAGMEEMNLKFPYGVQGEIQIDAVNKWFEINGIKNEVSLEECEEIVNTSDSIVEQKLGLEFDEESVQYYDGTQYYTGDFFNEDGINMMRMVGIEDLIHWPSGSFAQVAWDFMSQYARDTETGELIVLEAE